MITVLLAEDQGMVRGALSAALDDGYQEAVRRGLIGGAVQGAAS